MKKLGVLLLTLSLFLGLLPQTVAAAEITAYEQELTTYIGEISTVRGFDISKEDINKTLAIYDLTTNDFDSVNDLKIFLGDVIHVDLSNLVSVYEVYELDQTSLSQVLSEYGEELNDYIFLNDLNSALTLYTSDNEIVQEPNFEANLTTYLAKVSEERGFEVTRYDFDQYLAEYYTSTSEFESVDELSDFLGDVIKADLSNLDYFNSNYNLDQQSLFQLIKDNGQDINDFIYISDLEELVWSSDDSAMSGIDPENIMDMLNEIGLTEQELQNLQDYFVANTDYLSSPEVQAQLENLGTRMMAFAENLITKATDDPNYKPTDSEIAELESLFNELITIVKLKAVFSLTNNGIDTPLTFAELVKLENIKDSDLKIKIYNSDSELLADIVITSEYINSKLGEIVKAVDNSSDVKSDNNLVQTIKGGKLPKTASNNIPNAILGLLIAIAGLLVYRKARYNNVEILEKQIQQSN